jgi:hypothetical protein
MAKLAQQLNLDSRIITKEPEDLKHDATKTNMVMRLRTSHILGLETSPPCQKARLDH